MNDHAAFIVAVQTQDVVRETNQFALGLFSKTAAVILPFRVISYQGA
jgi:hypothetical protein